MVVLPQFLAVSGNLCIEKTSVDVWYDSSGTGAICEVYFWVYLIIMSRSFAENVLYCTIKIGQDETSQPKKERKRIKKEGLDAKHDETAQECVLKRSCALLNSGGGVLVIKISDFQILASKPNALDNFWKKVEPHLKAMIKPSSYFDVFDRSEHDDEILLFVNAPQHLCTMEYNLFVPGDTSVDEASYEETFELLKKTPQSRRHRFSKVEVSLEELPEIPEVFIYNQVLNLKESKQIQLKCFKSKAILDSANHAQRQSISKYVSAFANAGGGVIILGVEDGGRVCGQDMERTQNTEENVISIINNMYWNFNPERKVHWDVQFFSVSGCESKAIVVIYVAGMGSSGGVFAKSPKSFALQQSTDGLQSICRLEFGEWKQRMLSGEGLQSNRKAMQAMLSRFEECRVPKGHLMTVKGDVQRIRDAFFIVKEEFPVFPDGFESNLPKEAQTVIQEIQRKCTRDRNRGLLVASRSWLGNTGGTPMDGVVCDLLLISRNMGGLHLFTLCHSATDDRFLKYGRETARSIKRSLVKDGACKRKFYVSYHVVSCADIAEVELASRDVRYPKGYDLESSREKLNDVLKAMVIILASVPSPLSNKLGVSIMNLLTREQFQLVHQQIEINRELWIKGVAGTGKTLVAVEFMRELHRREKLPKTKILCVCENEGIANQIRESDVCTVVCRQTFIGSEFPGVRHVVMDEVHNYEQPVGTESWFHKARNLVRQHDPDRPGYLWFFTDNCQSNHTFPTGIPPETQQQPQFRLKKVIRNSRKIFNHSKQYVTEVADALEMGHDFEGECVETKTYSESETSQPNVVNEIYYKLSNSGYRDGDVAILFKKQDCIPPDLPFTFKTATENSSDSLVVSTVLKYSGLERPVVVLVDAIDHIPRGRKQNPFIYCAVTRAMVKLVIIRCKN
ncbi:hypothetical protein ACROYT_G002582 [Oculina patagonica]